MEQSEELTPFWLQSSADRRRRRRSSSSLFLNSGVFVIFLLLTAILFMLFVIPSVLSFTSQIFRPNSVKKSWDSLNVVLVLFAVVFGFLSRNRNGDSSYGEVDRTVYSNVNPDVPKSNPTNPQKWYDYSDLMVYSSAGMGGLRRSSSSYPDLREGSSWLTGDDRWRSLDDTHVESYQLSESGHLQRRRSWRELERQVSDTKNINVDTFLTRPQEAPDAPPPPPSPPPPPPPPPPVSTLKQKRKRTHRSVQKEKKKEQETKDSEPKELAAPPPAAPPPPPPPPPATPLHYYYQKSSKSNRKRVGANATKEFLTSFYHKRKKKRERRRSIENFEDLLRTQTQIPPLHQQPPPTPPPPPSVFQNLFSSKKSKHKRSYSDPPPEFQPPLTVARASKTTTQKEPVTTRTPPVPVKLSSFSSVDDNPNSGGESPLIGIRSPLIPIPPPPPPPPFKIPAWKFVVQGDYVRVQSIRSSRSGSPDLEDSESPLSSASVVEGGDPTPSVFCPSPDVNTKADNFIARFRAGLKLEKINSISQKQGLGLSNLGPEVKPTPNPSQILY